MQGNSKELLVLHLAPEWKVRVLTKGLKKEIQLEERIADVTNYLSGHSLSKQLDVQFVKDSVGHPVRAKLIG